MDIVGISHEDQVLILRVLIFYAFYFLHFRCYRDFVSSYSTKLILIEFSSIIRKQSFVLWLEFCIWVTLNFLLGKSMTLLS